MRRLPLKAIAVLLLGVWVALAASLAAAQLSGMAAEMAMSAECPGVGQGGCDDCPDGDQQNAAACVAACAMTTVAVLPTALSREAAHAPALPLPLRLSLRGKPSSPDPYPPKPHDLG